MDAKSRAEKARDSRCFVVEYIGEQSEGDYGVSVVQDSGRTYFIPFGEGTPIELEDSEIGGTEVAWIPEGDLL